MKPLIFLAFKTMVNGLRRAVGSPQRLIGLICLLGYWAYYLFNPFMGSARSMNFTPGGQPFHLTYPVNQVLDAAFFALFVLLSIPMLTAVANYNRVMRPADVDVLFPTPIDPRIVMVFRIIRDFLTAMLFPFIILLFSRRYIPIGEFLGAAGPGTGFLIGRTFTLTWILLSLAWTSIGYSATLFVNRSDLASDRNKRILDISTTVLILGTLGFVAYTLGRSFTVPTALGLAANPVLRILFLPATLGTALTLGPIMNPGLAAMAAVSLVAIIVLFLRIAFSQVAWMYDQAAVKGFASMEQRAIMKSGDAGAMLAFRARQGKLKAGRSDGWLHRLKMRGPAATLWRELITYQRTSKSSLIIVPLMGLFYSLFPVILLTFLPTRKLHRTEDVMGYMVIMFQCVGVFAGTMTQAQMGFTEFLRRVDLLKPLPFSASSLVVSEIFGKSVVPVLTTWSGGLIAICIKPSLWTYIVSSGLIAPAIGGLILGSSMLVLLTFPDIDDPTQRSFRGLVTMLAIALTVGPVIAAFVLLNFLTHQLVIAAIVATALAAAAIVGLGYLAGNQYLNYNPSE